MNYLLWAVGLFSIISCSNEQNSQLQQNQTKGYVDIMPVAQKNMYKAMMPKIEDADTQAIVDSAETMWYDALSIVPGYQDSMGDPEGMRPNTIQAGLIDGAVPGGWASLFQSRGRFNFPFATGGADRSDNLVKINFWAPPKKNGQVLPVVYTKYDWSRWQWLFPVGTVIGEVLMTKFPDGEIRVFEVRTRTRLQSIWVNQIFRPFLTATDLADAVKAERPDWENSAALKTLVNHLENNANLTAASLETEHFPGTFPRQNGFLDKLPDFGDAQLAKDLLKNTLFKATAGIAWKQNGASMAFAPSATTANSIVPRNYDGGLLTVDDHSCNRCHSDAGRSIRDFYRELVLYGELWGDDQIFSWHPFETEMFVKANGDVANFNDDNRRLRSDFANAGLVVRYDASQHPADLYKALPRTWVYNPVKRSM